MPPWSTYNASKMKRIFPNQAEAVANALYEILEEQKRASRVLEKTVEAHPKWGARDRKLLYEAVYSILRWKRKFDAMAEMEEREFHPWPWIKSWCILNDYAIPDWKEMECSPHGTKEELMAFHTHEQDVMYAFPSWLYALGKNELKAAWESEMNALNSKAAVALRVNRILASPKKLAEKLLNQFQLETELNPHTPDALYLSRGRKLNKNPWFRKGYFEIQDANSQRIAPFCMVKPGMKVIDLCAGAGGKTLHLAALMRNQGKIRAFDVEVNKLMELNKRIKRAKVLCVETANIDEEVLKENHAWADVVLIDAPCSGLGTLKRNPEIKWQLSLDRLKELQTTQRELLEQAVSLIQKGGKIVYATCSVLPSENQEQTTWFLNRFPSFKLEEDRQILGQESDFDGFYMARFSKK